MCRKHGFLNIQNVFDEIEKRFFLTWNDFAYQTDDAFRARRQRFVVDTRKRGQARAAGIHTLGRCVCRRQRWVGPQPVWHKSAAERTVRARRQPDKGVPVRHVQEAVWSCQRYFSVVKCFLWAKCFVQRDAIFVQWDDIFVFWATICCFWERYLVFGQLKDIFCASMGYFLDKWYVISMGERFVIFGWTIFFWNDRIYFGHDVFFWMNDMLLFCVNDRLFFVQRYLIFLCNDRIFWETMCYFFWMNDRFFFQRHDIFLGNDGLFFGWTTGYFVERYLIFCATTGFLFGNDVLFFWGTIGYFPGERYVIYWGAIGYFWGTISYFWATTGFLLGNDGLFF